MIERQIKFTSQRKFGVELEFNSPGRERLKNIVESAGEDCYCNDYTHNVDNTTWCAKTDCSCGFELASRVMSGWRDVVKLGEVVAALRDFDCQFNEQCGLHVHVNVSDMNREQVKSMLAWWMKTEHIFFSMMPNSRRTSSYCAYVNTQVTQFVDQSSYSYDINRMWNYMREYRRAFNIAHVSIYGHSRVEFRLGAMSLNPEYVKNWVRLLIMFVDTVKTLPRPADLKWLTPKRFLRMLGLLNQHKNLINIHYSEAVQGVRRMIIDSIRSHGELNYAKTNSDIESVVVDAEVLVEAAA